MDLNLDEGLLSGRAQSARFTPEEAEATKRAWQRRLAADWLSGKHVLEVCIRAGVGVGEGKRAIAWGLLGLGEVTLDDMIRHGFYKPPERQQEARHEDAEAVD